MALNCHPDRSGPFFLSRGVGATDHVAEGPAYAPVPRLDHCWRRVPQVRFLNLGFFDLRVLPSAPPSKCEGGLLGFLSCVLADLRSARCIGALHAAFACEVLAPRKPRHPERSEGSLFDLCVLSQPLRAAFAQNSVTGSISISTAVCGISFASQNANAPLRIFVSTDFFGDFSRN